MALMKKIAKPRNKTITSATSKKPTRSAFDNIKSATNGSYKSSMKAKSTKNSGMGVTITATDRKTGAKKTLQTHLKKITKDKF